MARSPEIEEPAEPAPPVDAVTRVRWWIAGLTFVAGAVVGVLITGLLIGTTPDFGSTGAGPEASVPPNHPDPTSSVPVTAEARVNAACLRVINEAQDVYRILSGADEAVRDVDFQRLDDIVRRLQPVEARLERDLQECRVDTSIREGTTARPASPIPTLPQPSATTPR
ncbi:MAG TPA: hypothetical protein VEX66_16340 [Microlunatus sp.]|nr:hypothetical protein [Microlunatus sp.]